jgi:hypothetical protein
MSHEPGFAFAQDVEKQRFGVLAGTVGVWPEGQAFGRAGNEGAE